MSSAFQGTQFGLDLARLRAVVPVGLKFEVDKQPIVSVARRSSQSFTSYRHQSLPFLAGALGDELLRPVSKGFDLLGRHERHLVPAGARRLRQDDAQLHAGIVLGRHAAGAGVDHALGSLEQSAHVHTLQRGRDHAEVRQGRVAAADIRLAVNDSAELVLARQLFERRSGIGDGHKVLPGAVALQLANTLVEVFEKGQTLGGASRLAGDQKQRARGIDRLLQPHDAGRYG